MKNLLPLFVIVLLFPFFLKAQNSDSIAFAYIKAPVLTNSTPMKIGAKSPKFLSRVGGVSFDQVAIPNDRWKFENITFDYTPDNEDGNRLIIKAGQQLVHVKLYDWQLIPIANYANSEYYSCFTYFGKLDDQNIEKQINDQGGHILNYHPAFENNLLGIRLGYMDLLYMYPYLTAELPKVGGEYVLGANEVKPDFQNNLNYRFRFQNLITTIQNQLRQQFRSYVISDFNRKIVFNIENDSLQLTGTPFYYCWRHRVDQPDFNHSNERKRIREYYLNSFGELSSQQVQPMLIDSVIEIIAIFNEKYDHLQEQDMVYEINNMTSIEQKRNALKDYNTESLLNLLIDFKSNMVAMDIEYLKEYSLRLSENITILQGLNPAVWDATVNTMQYAAFFRYLKKHYPENWTDFIAQIKDINVQPSYQTPTVLYPSRNINIEGVLKQ